MGVVKDAIDWIFSKLRVSSVKQGMPKSKNGRKMGGKESSNDKQSSPTTTDGRMLDSPSGGLEGSSGVNTASTDATLGGDDSTSSGSSSVNGGSPCPIGSRRKKKKHQNHHQHKKLRLTASTTTDTDENESDISSTLEREAPDGGWGWVVVGAAFLVNLIADGVTFSFGVYYSEFSDVFGSSKATTAWVGSLLAAMPLLSGPIASSLTDRYGCRIVTICGGLLASLGFILSSYATSIHMLMLTFGVITGFGLSLCYVSAVVIVAYYFERRRSLATGLSVCGGGIGTFVFAPLTQFLIERYGWRGATLILSGCFLNLCVCGALMRDLEWTKKSSKTKNKLLQNEHDFNTQAQLNLLTQGGHSIGHPTLKALKNERLCNSALCIPTFVQEQERRNSSRRIRYFSNHNGNTNQLALPPTTTGGGSDNTITTKKDDEKISKCNNNSKDFETETEKDRELTPTIGCIISKSNSTSSPIQIDSNLINFNSGVASPTNNKLNSNNSYSSNNNVHNSTTILASSNANNENQNQQNGNLSGSDVTVQQQKQQAMRNYVVHHTRLSRNWSGRHRHSLTYRGAVLSLKRYRLRPASSCPDIISVATVDQSAHEWKAVLADVYVWIRGIFAWDNLANTRFLMFILSNFLLYTWYDIPYIFLSDYATEVNYTKAQCSWLSSTIGISNVVGNIFLGYIGDKRWADSIQVYGVCIAICGVAVGLMPYLIVKSYISVSVLCGFFGVMIAANYSLTPVILVKVVSLERFANAYGLLLLVQGIGNLIGPPIAGWLYDWTGKYTWSFIVAGIGIFASNFFILAPIYKSGDNKSSNSSGSSIDREDSQA